MMARIEDLPGCEASIVSYVYPEPNRLIRWVNHCICHCLTRGRRGYGRRSGSQFCTSVNAIEGGIDGFPHHAHAAFADLLDQSVVVKNLPDSIITSWRPQATVGRELGSAWPTSGSVQDFKRPLNQLGIAAQATAYRAHGKKSESTLHKQPPGAIEAKKPPPQSDGGFSILQAGE
jgi:hypothetical protein